VPKTVVIDRGAAQPPAHPFQRWLLADLEVKGTEGQHTREKKIVHPWWKVMCLTGKYTRRLSPQRPTDAPEFLFSKFGRVWPTCSTTKANLRRDCRKGAIAGEALRIEKTFGVKMDTLLCCDARANPRLLRS
jgi:hypothetical protein